MKQPSLALLANRFPAELGRLVDIKTIETESALRCTAVPHFANLTPNPTLPSENAYPTLLQRINRLQRFLHRQDNFLIIKGPNRQTRWK